MKKLYFLILILTANSLFAQIQIGTGTNETNAFPMDPYFGFSYTQSIYYASDIATSGDITYLSYYYSGTSDLQYSDDDIQIYIGHTNLIDLSSTWASFSSLTLVFDGSLPSTSPGWIEIPLDVPFSYNGTDNLLIAMDANELLYDTSADDFYCTFGNAGCSRYFSSDGTNPDPASPPAGTASSYYANIIIGIQLPLECVANSSPVDSEMLDFYCGGSVDIQWDEPFGDPDSYDIYFGTSATPTFYANTTDLSISIDVLDAETTYYYQIIPISSTESVTNCDIISFETGADIIDGGFGGTSELYYFANNNYSAGTPAQDYEYFDPFVDNHTEIVSWTSGSDDDGYFMATLPFNFKYYGVDYSEVYISTNGYVSFGAGNTETGGSVTLGSTSDPDNMIAAAMMDLDDIADGQIFYHELDPSTFVITWYHYHDYFNDDEYITMQLVLQKNADPTKNGLFQIRYNQNESSATLTEILSDAVIGCENLDGSEFAMYRQDGGPGPMFCSPLNVAFGPEPNALLLPVDLLSFQAEPASSGNMLEWSTATEINTDYFLIEASTDLNNWQPVEKIKAVGFSSEKVEYSYLDESAYFETYYRLKVVDFDGKFEYSPTVFVYNIAFFNFELNLSPNPFSDQIILDFTVDRKSTLYVEVYDLAGQLLKQSSFVTKIGANSTKLDLDNLESGVYMVKSSFEGIPKTSKIIKL